MNLPLYSSVSPGDTPNLIGLQDEIFGALPTVLVCPMSGEMPVTLFRIEILWRDEQFVACPDLTRPIRRRALRLIDRLDDPTSREIMRRFQSLLAR